MTRGTKSKILGPRYEVLTKSEGVTLRDYVRSVQIRERAKNEISTEI